MKATSAEAEDSDSETVYLWVGLSKCKIIKKFSNITIISMLSTTFYKKYLSRTCKLVFQINVQNWNTPFSYWTMRLGETKFTI